MYPVPQTKIGAARKRKASGERKSSLDCIEQKLLFAQVYQKIIHCNRFKASYLEWRKAEATSGLPISKQTLDDIGVMSRSLNRRAKVNLILRILSLMAQKRPVSDPKRLEYRLCITVDRRHDYYNSQKGTGVASDSYLRGKTYDKKVHAWKRFLIHEHMYLHKDTGSKDYEPKVGKLYQPKKTAQ